MMSLGGALVCFGSFGWGMARHFRRNGPFTRAMALVSIVAFISAVLQIARILEGRPWHPSAACVLYGTSAALFWWAVAVTRGKLAACGQQQVSPAIIQEGPFRFIRHPFYCAYNLAWVAGAVATGAWQLLIAAIFMALLYERAAREEERGFRSGPLSETYRCYAGITGRYLPRIRTPRPITARPGRSDLSNA